VQQKEKIINYFEILRKRNILSSSYLFIGKDYDVVFDIIKLISCKEAEGFCNKCWDCKQIDKTSHPDLFLIEPDKFNIKIDEVRQAIKFLSLKSFKLPRKILLIKQAQYFSPAAANAFLKTLEEAPKNSLIFICSSQLEALLPTIISRCRKIFLPFTDSDKELSQLNEIMDFLSGRDIFFKDRKKFAAFLWTFVMLLREQINSLLGFENNHLLKNRECEIILGRYTLSQIYKLSEDILKVYSASKSVNMNLALNLLKTRL
jgi:hypothetical protein|tara:strand:+ start:2938 stop:3717 length:780 start_codon:yes stop_codon:yes gene_type:complete